MSKETILPAEGPAGPGQNPQQEQRHLSNCNDACDNESSTPNTSRTAFPRDSSTEGRSHMTGEDSAFYGPVRTQPQPAPSAKGGALVGGDAARNQNGPANPTTMLSNANGILQGSGGGRTAHTCSCVANVVQGTGSAPNGGGTTQPPRKQSSPVSQKMRNKLRSSLSVDSDSSRRSKGSSQGLHKPDTLPEDCCVHCILACLFCEFLTLCNMVVAQASCGTCTPEACCCCCCTDDMGDDCSSPCDMDCGIMDACCESSDCLEICMECCGICFPT